MIEEWNQNQGNRERKWRWVIQKVPWQVLVKLPSRGCPACELYIDPRGRMQTLGVGSARGCLQQGKLQRTHSLPARGRRGAELGLNNAQLFHNWMGFCECFRTKGKNYHCRVSLKFHLSVWGGGNEWIQCLGKETKVFESWSNQFQHQMWWRKRLRMEGNIKAIIKYLIAFLYKTIQRRSVFPK